MDGSATLAIVAAVARLEPQIAAKPPQARQYTFFEMFFWGPPYQQSTYGNKPQKSQLDQSTAYAQQQYQQPAYAQQAPRAIPY